MGPVPTGERPLAERDGWAGRGARAGLAAGPVMTCARAQSSVRRPHLEHRVGCTSWRGEALRAVAETDQHLRVSGVVGGGAQHAPQIRPFHRLVHQGGSHPVRRGHQQDVLECLPAPQPIGAAVVCGRQQGDDRAGLEVLRDQPFRMALRGEVTHGEVFTRVLRTEYRLRETDVGGIVHILVHPATAFQAAAWVGATAPLGLGGQSQQMKVVSADSGRTSEAPSAWAASASSTRTCDGSGFSEKGKRLLWRCQIAG